MCRCTYRAPRRTQRRRNRPTRGPWTPTRPRTRSRLWEGHRMHEPAILVENLSKHFGEVAALDGVDLEVERGTVFGLLGPNGAGKTTAVRVLATILKPDGGRAEVLGRDVTREPAAVRRRIGLAGQYAAVDPNLT